MSFSDQKPTDGCKFQTKTCEWVIILIHKTSELVTISIVLLGNGWFSSKLNETYCSLVNFGSCSIVNSLGMGMFLLMCQL